MIQHKWTYRSITAENGVLYQWPGRIYVECDRCGASKDTGSWMSMGTNTARNFPIISDDCDIELCKKVMQS